MKEIDDDVLRQVFKQFDQNNDGFIQKDELGEIIKQLGESVTDVELNALFAAADLNNDGYIDLAEFLMVAQAKPASFMIKEVFDDLDADGNGNITKSEFIKGFEKLGQTLTAHQTNLIFKQMDDNRDGRINFNEFCKFMTRKPF